MIKILIADDQTLMRDGLKTILELEDDMEVIATCENGQIAYEKSKELKPDVILMDIRMPIMNGVESVKLIKKEIPSITIIMLTTFDDDEYIIEALSNGANGYLLKDIPGDKLLQAIRDGFHGNLLIPGNIAAKIVSKLSSASKEKHNSSSDYELLEELSEREAEIAKLLVKGYTNKQIAASLFISEGTVKNYISNIYSKLGISDRTQAALFLKEKLNIN